jgi:hypothetical protein
VLASVGLPDAGGLDVDAAIVAYVLAAHPTWDAGLRERLDRPATAADRRARNAIAGTWTGTMTQSDGIKWKMELRITGGSPGAEVRYAELRCSGNLSLTGVDGADLRAEEWITQGLDHCTAHGAVTLRPSDGKLLFWYQPDGAAYTATGLLTRSTG